jgi:putative aldouronate transport system permease protein
MRKRIGAFDVFLTLFCIVVAVVTLYPMWYVIAMSFNDPTDAARGYLVFNLFPTTIYLGGYQTILKDPGLWRAALISVFYVVTGTLLMLLTSMLMAFPLVRPHLKFRKVVVFFLLIPMYFSGGLIPSFLVIKNLGMYNTVWAMILPGAFGIWNIILVRTFFMSIPVDLAEAAVIDGIGNFGLMTKIYVPLSKAVFAVIAIYTIVGIWNSWFNAMVYLQNSSLHPLQMYLQRILIQQSVDLTKLKDMNYSDMNEIAALMKRALSARQLKYSMIVVVTMPVLMVYPFFQKHFVKGVMLGSLKG